MPHFNESSALLFQRCVESGIESPAELANIMGNASVETKGFTNRQRSTPRSNIVKKLRMLAINLALLGYGASAVAADSRSQSIKSHAPKGITTAFYTCVDKAGSDTVAAGACLSDEQTRQDNRLNASYKALLGKLTPKNKEALILAEREWLKFQEANGEFENGIYGNENVANLQLTQNEMFRICDRANALDTYLIVANIQ